jgi:hypothetical protein
MGRGSGVTDPDTVIRGAQGLRGENVVRGRGGHD